MSAEVDSEALVATRAAAAMTKLLAEEANLAAAVVKGRRGAAGARVGPARSNRGCAACISMMDWARSVLVWQIPLKLLLV